MTHRTFLVAVAHPDDCELTCAGAIARQVDEDDRAVLMVATDGARGGKVPGSDAARMVTTRHEEQEKAAAFIGFTSVIWLGFEDGTLAESPDLSRRLVETVRRVQPDVAVFMDPTAIIFRDAYVNHQDHRTLGMAMLDAMYPAASNAGYFSEQIESGLEPYKVPEVWLAQTEHPNFWVDVSSTLDRRFDALRLHRSQMRLWPDGGEAVIAQQREYAAVLGVQHGVRYAEEYRRIVVNPLA